MAKPSPNDLLVPKTIQSWVGNYIDTELAIVLYMEAKILSKYDIR